MNLRFLLVLAGLMLSLYAPAQSLRSIDVAVHPDRGLPTLQSSRSGATRLASCGPDTLGYSFLKAFYADTGFQVLGIGNPAPAVGQLFPIPADQAVAIRGLSFYGFAGVTDTTRINVKCSVYAVSATGTPTGNPLGTVTVKVDSTFGNGAFSALFHTATFPTPVVVSNNYFVVLENLSDSTLGVVSTNWLVDAGKNEQLGAIKFNNTWYKSTQLTIGGANLDCDFLIQPHVEYPLVADFDVSVACATLGTPVSLTNTSSKSLINSKFYNLEAFYAAYDNVALDSIYFWDYGDNSFGYTENGQHTYNVAANGYDVTLITGLFQFNGFPCIDSVKKRIVICGAGVEDQLTAEQLSVYPNPGQGFFTLKLELDRPSDLVVRITDLSGRELSMSRVGRISSGEVPLDLNFLSTGIYLLDVQVDGLRGLRKIVVE